LAKIDRIRIGGLKVMEEGACVVSSSPPGANCLDVDICAPLAQNRINLTFLAHIAGDNDYQVLCTAGEAGETAFTLLKAQAVPEATVQLQPGTAVLALYPHNKRPEIIGNFIHSLAQARVKLHGLASSPSAISAVLSSRRTKATVRQLFENFQFPAFESPQDFFAAQPPPAELVEKVVATYQEKVTKVYCIVPQPDLDLWGASLSSNAILEGFAAALMDLGDLGLQLPFLAAIPELENKEFLVSFSTRGDQSGEEKSDEVRGILQRRLPDIRLMHVTPVAGIFLHGPHFGDRYGIAHTLVDALDKAHISLLGLSCTISSISLIIRQQELAAAQVVLGNTFAAPVECPAAVSNP
jgi:aspartokinase